MVKHLTFTIKIPHIFRLRFDPMHFASNRTTSWWGWKCVGWLGTSNWWNWGHRNWSWNWWVITD